MGVGSDGHPRPPLVVIVNDQEWSTRSLESILGPHGYAVMRAFTANKGFERATATRPDMILIGASLPDMDGLELCDRLRADPRITASTPIIMITTGKPSRNERLAALRAGAWDYLGHPIDAEQLVLRFDAFVRAKQDADQARTEGMIDALTGLYSVQGLARRARELASQAYRTHSPLACVVFHIEAEDEDGAVIAAIQAVADRFHRVGRGSDAVGRIGEAEIAVFADADRRGVESLVQRLATAADESPPGWRITTGFDAVDDFRAANLQPQDMLARATAALRERRRSGPAEPVGATKPAASWPLN